MFRAVFHAAIEKFHGIFPEDPHANASDIINHPFIPSG
jgi:hypothetical protein